MASVLPEILLAQQNQEAQQDPSSISTATALKELAAMRARIEQLEAELKKRDANSAPPVPGQSAALVTEKTDPPAEHKKPEPFEFADFTWLNGNSRQKYSVLDSKVFTGEFRVDTSYIYDFNHPQDHTLGGTSESGRTNEVQVQQLGIGGDFHYNNARGRLMTQFGMYSTMTPRNDASPARGQWNLADAYRSLSEAYGGYHLNALHGINVDAGIFMSYVGLFSYYNFDNWAYQPSYVSSNTPWFFNGVRVQIFPTEKLKIEPWFVNGWQSYGVFNKRPGLGAQVLWRPNGSLSILSNNYGIGRDTLGVSTRTRWHTDNSIQIRINGAPAFSCTPYFSASPGDPFKAWDASSTFDYMPTQFTTFRFEFNHRAANVPYFVGGGGITPPGGDTGAPGSLVPGLAPDLRKRENRFNLAVLVKF